jgi:outer membrane protein assembly factor BamB
VAALFRVNAADGTIEWTDPISPDEETSTPIILAHGGVDMFAYGTHTADSVFTFDPASGASTSTTFGFTLYDAPGDLAVGADGSLYVTHEDGVGTVKQTTYVSRVAPSGAVLWTSVDLATLAPPDQYGDGEVFPATIALGKGDLVIVEVDVIVKTGDVASVIALDPATGAARWTTNLSGELVGGPVVRADGTIVALVDEMDVSSLVVLDPEKGTPTTIPLASGAFEIAAVTEGGAVIGGGDTGNGVTGIVAIGSDGAMLWSGPGGGRATIAKDGTVISFGPEITALDGATGEVKWQLAPPVPGNCIADAALTSEGGIVALQCDGTLFGASD